ncbi:hypothetical protein FOZ60_016878 [Perkinsus olseni]|uniref:CCHC-type domain-containing protein n=1 Tax=Perkinsus olseni TaxID=32597 RepID=A0A7J6P612_PEROL|nr:hypothetical protein FOZ60_016878 [Perkinsus olseni]
MEQLTMNEGDTTQQGASQDEAVTVFETQAGPPGAQEAAKGAGRRRGRRSPFAGKCYGCQEFGHRIADCPQRKNSAGDNKEGKAGGSTEAATAESGGPVDDAEKSPPGEDKTKPRESEDCTVQTASYAVDCYTVPIASYAFDCHHAKQSAGNDSVRSYAITEADSPPVLLLDFGVIDRKA